MCHCQCDALLRKENESLARPRRHLLHQNDISPLPKPMGPSILRASFGLPYTHANRAHENLAPRPLTANPKTRHRYLARHDRTARSCTSYPRRGRDAPGNLFEEHARMRRGRRGDAPWWRRSISFEADAGPRRATPDGWHPLELRRWFLGHPRSRTNLRSPALLLLLSHRDDSRRDAFVCRR
jgi:hypothetical protein